MNPPAPARRTVNLGNGDAAVGGSGTGSVTVTASTFSGNTASTRDGGAIDGGDVGGGTVTVTASTFSGNAASRAGGAINNGEAPGLAGGASVAVAGDLFDGSCAQLAGTWTDGGYNAGTDASCFAPTPQPGDTSSSNVHTDLQTAPTGNGGPTKTIKPTTGNPAIALIPDPTTVTVGGGQVALCPAADQRGYATAASAKCDAGAVQTSGQPPALTLKDSAAPASFNAAGQLITYHYQVTNTGAGTLSGIRISDPAVPAVSCPAASLAPGASQTCTGARAVTPADLAAGKITDTAAAAGAAASGVPVASKPATVTVPEGWPPAVTGSYQPPAHAAEGYYLGVAGSTWTLIATHPGGKRVVFTGTVRLNAGAFGDVDPVQLESNDSLQVKNNTLTFRFVDYGDIDGVQFDTSPATTKITFTLDVFGHPATAGQLFLGAKHTRSARGSPLTFTR